MCYNMGFRLRVLFQTILLCAYTNFTMSANSKTTSDNSGNRYSKSGNSYKTADDSEKVPDNVYKIPNYSEKVPDNVYKMSDNRGKVPDNVYKIPNYSEKVPDNVYKMSDDRGKVPDNVYKMSGDGDKMSDDSYITSSLEKSINFLGLFPLYNLYNKCVRKDASKTLEECLSTQVVVLIDKMAHQESIPLTDGFQLVGKQKSLGRSLSGQEKMLTEDILEASLPRNLGARQGILDNLIVEKLISLLKSHLLEIELPSSRTFRGLKLSKLFLPFLMGVILKVSSLVPVILSIMSTVALYGLVAGKAALSIIGILGLRSLFQHGNHNVHHKGPHAIQHELGVPHLGHGLPNLIHNFEGADHGYGVHGSGDVNGFGNTHGDTFTGHSITDIINGPFHAGKSISERMDNPKFKTTVIPQYIQNFHDAGLAKAIVVSG